MIPQKNRLQCLIVRPISIEYLHSPFPYDTGKKVWPYLKSDTLGVGGSEGEGLTRALVNVCGSRGAHWGALGVET